MKILKLVGKNVTFSPESNKKIYKKKNKESKKKEDKKYRKIRIRHQSLLKLLYSLIKKPDWFLTLIYPNSFPTDVIIDQIKNDINKLNNRLRDTYKRCWFVYSIEHVHKFDIHLHLIGKLDCKKKKPNLKNQKKFRLNVYKWWAKIVGSDEEKLSHVLYLKNNKKSDRCTGYLVKSEKKINLGFLIEKFGKQYTHGVINRKNLPKAKPLKIKISNKDFNKYIRPALLKDANKVKCRDTSFHKSKLEKNYSGYHILNQPKKFRALLKKKGVEV